MNINLDLYKIFYYVAKNESITRASNELLISQPAISKSIKTLESQLNTQLFIRKRDGVILTEIGEIIYKKIKEAMELIDSCENDIESLTNLDSGIINIGASKTIIHEYLMSYIKNFHDNYPNIKIRVFTDKTSDLMKKAKIGLIDIIFTNIPCNIPDNFETLKLLELQDCLVANTNFSYLKNKQLTTKDLEKLPLLVLTKGATSRINLDNYCVDNNITINPEMEFGSNTLIKEFTEAGFGVGMLTKEYIKDELNNGTLFELKISPSFSKKQLGMVYDSNRKSNIIIKKFIEFIKKNQ